MTAADENICSQLTDEELETVFRFLSREDAGELCRYLDEKVFAAGEMVMNEGDPADYMAFLLSGKLAIKKETNFPGKHVLVAIIERGSMVGELAVVDQNTRTATVEAMEPSRLLVLTSDSLEKMIEEEPKLGVKVLKRILHVVSLRVRKADDRLSKLL